MRAIKDTMAQTLGPRALVVQNPTGMCCAVGTATRQSVGSSAKAAILLLVNSNRGAGLGAGILK